MAKTTTVTITDDIDGSANAQTYELTYEGTAYTIDLSKKNKSALDKALKPYLDSATRVRGTRTGRRGGARGRSDTSGRRQDLGDVRAWLRSQGHQVSDKGRIPRELMAEYDAAH